MAKHLKKEASQLNLIVLHLGSGASACCVKNGQSLDTSMGLTPLSGLPGSTRAGQVDPSLIFHYTNKAKAITHDREMASNLHVTDAEYILNSQSGWNAIAGTKEFGDITAKAFQQLGDNPEQFYPGPGAKADLPPEALAFAIFVDRIIDYVAPYHMKLNGEVDAIVFSGGVGEKSHQLRSVLAHRVCTPAVNYLGAEDADLLPFAVAAPPTAQVLGLPNARPQQERGRGRCRLCCGRLGRPKCLRQAGVDVPHR